METSNGNVTPTKIPEDDLSDSDASDGGLKIVLESPNPKRKQKVVNIDPEEKSMIESGGQQLQETLEETALENNLSCCNVKKILKQVVTNEHVLAMVKHTEDPENTEQPVVEFEPKLTRAKAKQLFSSQPVVNPMPWIPPPEPSEVSLLMNSDDLHEDSSGDEYVPNEEEASEDDHESTILSETDPSTPQSVNESPTKDDANIVLSEDGVFKVPRAKTREEEEEEANIALRTRSKLSLSSTPLEVIAESFIPPDITTDMYDMDCDDEDWTDFLKKFTRPLDEATRVEDEDHDPEYNVLADEEIDEVDKEELRADRAVLVTRKELNALVAELFEYVDIYSDNQSKITENFQIEPQITILNTETPQEQPTTETETAPAEESEPVADAEPLFSHDRLCLLEQQLRQHVQMLTQNFLLTFSHPEFNFLAVTYKEYLYNFKLLADEKETSGSVLRVQNLDSAISLIEDWERKFRTNSIEVEDAKWFVARDYDACKRNKATGGSFVSKLCPLVLETISSSDVFIYPSLLPRIPYKPSICFKRTSLFISHEDEIIAIGLEQFIPYLKENPFYTTKKGEVRLKCAASLISKFMMTAREASGIYRRILDNRIEKNMNPIKFYFENKRAPPTVHYVISLSSFGTLPPKKRPKEMLPYQWQQYNYPDEETQVSSKTVAYLPQLNANPCVQLPVTVATPQQVLVINNNGTFNTTPYIQLPQVTINTIPNNTNTRKPKPLLFPNGPIPETPRVRRRLTVQRKCKRITLTPPNRTKKRLECYFKPPFIIKKWLNAVVHSNVGKVKFNSSLLCARSADAMLLSMPTLGTPVKSHGVPERAEDCAREEPTQVNEVSSENDGVVQAKDNEATEAKDGEVTEAKDNKEKDNASEIQRMMAASATITPNKSKRKTPALSGPEKKKQKLRREFSATLNMFSPEDPKITEEKADSYAHAYYDKVRERLDVDDYHKVMEILNNYESPESVADLYKKVEAVFLPKHPDLADEFLTFLTPTQAKSVGKFVPYFMLNKMSLFLRKLEIYFKDQPSQVKKIYRSLNDLSTCMDVTMERIRSTVLPLLRRNKHLTDWFLQIFPTEPPHESLLNGPWEPVEVPREPRPMDDDSYETFTLPETEDPYGGPNCACTCHAVDDPAFQSRTRHCIPCGTKFLQGRVYVQAGKSLRLANITFDSKNRADTINRLTSRPATTSKRRARSPCKAVTTSPSKDCHEDGDEARQRSPRKRRIRTEKAATKAASEAVGGGKCRKSAKSRAKSPDLGVDSRAKVAGALKVTTESESEVAESDGNASMRSLRLSPEHSAESGSEYVEESSQDNINSDSGSDDDSAVSSSSSPSPSESEDLTWTRDEDKIILETFRKENSKAQALEKVSEKLVYRTLSQIKNRFHRLMKLLQEMAAGSSK